MSHQASHKKRYVDDARLCSYLSLLVRPCYILCEWAIFFVLFLFFLVVSVAGWPGGVVCVQEMSHVPNSGEML